MFKKLTIAAIAVLLVGGLLFGRNLVPYATTTFNKLKQSAQDSIPIDHQIDAAETQLKRIDPEVRRMRHEIAKETVKIKRLTVDMGEKQSRLDKQYAHIMKLRDHLGTGDSHYVSSGKAFSNDRVKKDLSNHFKSYKTAEATVEKLEQIVELRKQGLDSAKAKLKETIAQKHQLEVQLENLRARQQMIEVAETASKINFDDSQLSRTRDMIDNIDARLDVKSEMMNLLPESPGTIPMEDEDTTFDGDIVDKVDSYFNNATGKDVASK